MAYLARAKKVDLLELCEEMGLEIDPSSKIPAIKNLILRSESYVEEEARTILDRVIEDRKQNEQEIIAKEKERVEERVRQEEREERVRKEEREERLALEAKRHELEMKKLELLQINSNQKEESEKKTESARIQLNQITPKFDEKHDEMGLYLINFERRAEIAQVPKKDWVAYLLAVLPAELSNMLAREAPEDANNYDFVKSLILKRYKMNSEKLKQCFYKHHKSTDKSWRNYAQELLSYFTQWISELKIETFQQLKELMVTEQLKFRVPVEVREHYLEDWLKFISPLDLAEKLDDFESIKESFKKREFPKKNLPNFGYQKGNYNSYKPRENTRDYSSKFQSKTEYSQEKRNKEFDKRKTLRCFECGSSNHLRPQCDKLKKTHESVSNVVVEKSNDELMARYTSEGKVNGVKMNILRDTGATLDLICSKYVKPHMYTNEKVWLRTPLEETLVCLPLAEVEIECELGHIVTKAAVLRDSLDQGRYLLGNKTASLFEDCKATEDVQIHMLNAVQTRAQKKLLEIENIEQEQTEEHVEEELQRDILDKGSEELEEEDTIMPKIKELSLQELIKTSPKEFVKEQHKCEELRSLIEEARRETSKVNKYIMEKNLLFYRKLDNDETERKLLVVPKKYREQLKRFCHEDVAAHLGVLKTKDALFKTFFWPNCFKDVENYVKTCDYCQ